MSRFRFSSYAQSAFTVSCICTAALALLACCSGIMIRLGQSPLQYTILTRQMLRQIPTTFLCGTFAALLCDILQKRVASDEDDKR